MLGAAVDAGITFFDTSDLYSQGQSEILVGKALRSAALRGRHRHEGRLRRRPASRRLRRPAQARAPARRQAPPGVTAVGRRGAAAAAPDAAGLLARATSRRPSRRACAGCGPTTSTSTSSTARRARSSSAGDYIGVLEQLVDQGKIRHFGIAADAAGDVAGLRLHSAIASLQVPFSLVAPGGAMELFPAAAEAGTGVIARSCYAAGLFKDGIAPETLRELSPDAERILSLHAKADELGRPLLELALQFSLATDADRRDDPGHADPRPAVGQPALLRVPRH